MSSYIAKRTLIKGPAQRLRLRLRLSAWARGRRARSWSLLIRPSIFVWGTEAAQSSFAPQHLSGFRVDKVQLRARRTPRLIDTRRHRSLRQRTIPARFGGCSGSDRERSLPSNDDSARLARNKAKSYKKTMHPRTAQLLLILGLLLAGCTSSLPSPPTAAQGYPDRRAQSRQLNVRMTEAEVVAILGEPASTAVSTCGRAARPLAVQKMALQRWDSRQQLGSYISKYEWQRLDSK